MLKCIVDEADMRDEQQKPVNKASDVSAVADKR